MTESESIEDRAAEKFSRRSSTKGEPLEDALASASLEPGTPLDAILESMAEGVVVVGSDGSFKLFNAAARKMLGQGPTSESIDEWPAVYGAYRVDGETLIPKQQIPTFRALKGEAVDNFPVLLKTQEIPVGFHVSVSARPLRNPQGEIDGAVTVFRNVEDQYRHEAEMRAAREELERRVVERTLSLARANRELQAEIEERFEAERALKVSERQIRLMADSLPLLVAYVDDSQRYVFSNATYEDWFGMAPEDLRGKQVWEVLGIDRYKQVRALIEQVLLGEQVSADLKVEHRRSGKRRLNLTLVPDTDDDEVRGFYLVGVDVTERIAAAEAEIRHRDELAHVSRLATVGELTAAIAHELNQPLTSMRTSSHSALTLLEESEDIPARELGEILEEIVYETRRASEVIRRLRALLTRRQLMTEQLDINSVLHEISRLVQSDASLRDVKLSINTTDGLPAVRADRIYVQQVVLNLILNAFDAVAKLPEERRRVEVRSMRTRAGDVCVCVYDRGVGFKGVEVEKLFEPFYSTKKTGMGIGLSINRSIVDALGGHIWAEEHDDQGVTFHFTLPSV